MNQRGNQSGNTKHLVGFKRLSLEYMLIGVLIQFLLRDQMLLGTLIGCIENQVHSLTIIVKILAILQNLGTKILYQCFRQSILMLKNGQIYMQDLGLNLRVQLLSTTMASRCGIVQIQNGVQLKWVQKEIL